MFSSRLGDVVAIDQGWDDGLDWDGESVSYNEPAPASSTFAQSWLQDFQNGLLEPTTPAPPVHFPATVPDVPTLKPIVSSAPFNYAPAIALALLTGLIILAPRRS